MAAQYARTKAVNWPDLLRYPTSYFESIVMLWNLPAPAAPPRMVLLRYTTTSHCLHSDPSLWRWTPRQVLVISVATFCLPPQQARPHRHQEDSILGTI